MRELSLYPTLPMSPQTEILKCLTQSISHSLCSRIEFFGLPRTAILNSSLLALAASLTKRRTKISLPSAQPLRKKGMKKPMTYDSQPVNCFDPQCGGWCGLRKNLTTCGVSDLWARNSTAELDAFPRCLAICWPQLSTPVRWCKWE